MGEARQCCFETLSGSQCKVTRNLNRILVLEPESPAKEKWGCYEHLKAFINQQQDDINFKLNQVNELKRKIEESEKLDRLYRLQNEASGGRPVDLKSIDDKRKSLKKKLDDEIKNLRNNICRSLYCREPISPNQVKCALEIRTHYNTPRVNLFYHRECFYKIKGALGFILPIHNKQFTLEQIIPN